LRALRLRSLAAEDDADGGLSDALRARGADVTTVTWPADPAALAGQADADTVVVFADRALTVLPVLQALLGAAGHARVWVMTEGAVDVGDGEAPADPRAAQVWGLGRVAALEHPERWGGLIDLPPVLGERGLDRVISVFGGPEDQVAVRASGIFARRLVHARPATGNGWVPRGTVLVTGGSGGVAAHVARWLAASGAGHIVLASRRGLAAPGAGELVAELSGPEVGVSAVSCDVTDREAVRALVDLHPPDAVVHAAGVSGGAVAWSMTTWRGSRRRWRRRWRARLTWTRCCGGVTWTRSC
jgi:KR domain